MKYRAYGTILMTLVLVILIVLSCTPTEVRAASAMIEFSVDKTEVAKGDTFNIVATVNATENIGSVDAYVAYDASLMTFVNGGKYVSGGDGLLHIVATKLSGEKNRVKFSLNFKADAKGNSAVGISDQAVINNAAGEKMSSSSTRVSVNITSGGQQTTEATDGTVEVTVSPEPTPELSSDNRLKSLLVSAGVLDPPFNSEITKYTLTVDNYTSALYYSYKASDKGAVVSFSGNESLIDGKNKTKVKVKAPNGDVRTYSIIVTKETEEETKARELAESGGGAGIGFSVTEENGIVLLRNSYEFRVVDVEDSEQVPPGFVKTSVRLYGINVTAYTIANDLNNDILLMYCMNSNGDKDFYQYDRVEKSLQRYKGDLIDRVNSSTIPESAESMNAKEYQANLNQLAIIIAILAAVCVLLVISIVSILLRQIKSKSGRDIDELDF